VAEAESKTSRRSGQSFGLALVLALCAAAVVRLSDAGLHFVPRWLALIVIVFAGLEVLSIGWNIVQGEQWNEKTLFDYISDAFVWLP
jgi:hypothetical protein